MAQNLEPDAIGELHVPVLLDDVLNLLAPAFTGRETAWMVDATLGMVVTPKLSLKPSQTCM